MNNLILLRIFWGLFGVVIIGVIIAGRVVYNRKGHCKHLDNDDSNIEEGCRMCLLTGNSCDRDNCKDYEEEE